MTPRPLTPVILIAAWATACALDVSGIGGALTNSAADAATEGGDDGAISAIDSAPPDVVTFDAAAHDAAPSDAPLDQTALDAASDVSADVVIDAGPLLSAGINVNGIAHVSTSGPAQGIWGADPGSGGACGPNYFSVVDVYGTADQPLYTGEAWGNPLTCAIGGALPRGDYDVSLFFAEIYFGPGCSGGGGAGSRVFDIVIEGVPVATGIDVFALSGGCLASSTSGAQPVVRSFRVTVLDGTIDVSMPASQDNAKVSAIYVSGPF